MNARSSPKRQILVRLVEAGGVQELLGWMGDEPVLRRSAEALAVREEMHTGAGGV